MMMQFALKDFTGIMIFFNHRIRNHHNRIRFLVIWNVQLLQLTQTYILLYLSPCTTYRFCFFPPPPSLPLSSFGFIRSRLSLNTPSLAPTCQSSLERERSAWHRNRCHY